MKGEDMLSNRQRDILKAIIEEYINTAEPVSSAAILERYGLNCSSATIRNDMSELEGLGYLEKPHTSAGRIPSVKGYRFYVDELLNDENITLEEIDYIKQNLQTKVNEIEDLTKITTNTISEMTHYTTVAIGPDSASNIIKDIKFILLGERLLMAVILTENGAVKETIIKYDEDLTQNQVKDLNVTFNNKLRGKHLEKIDKPMEEYILSTMKSQAKVIKPIIQQMNKAIEETNKIYLEGASKAFDFPEFEKIDTAKNFLSILDTKEEMVEILNSGLAKDINVYIGDENENKDLKDLSIITFKHKVGNKDMGTIGIIGPKRMNYSKVISIMKYISKKLNDIAKVEQLQTLGFSENKAIELTKPDRYGEYGFPSYMLSNNNARIRDAKQRRDRARKLKETEDKDYTINGVRVVENAKENRLQLFFAGIVRLHRLHRLRGPI